MDTRCLKLKAQIDRELRTETSRGKSIAKRLSNEFGNEGQPIPHPTTETWKRSNIEEEKKVKEEGMEMERKQWKR
ncbi:hypothetical protein M8J77_013357 [Diaphorina citri]|nr:hypothetical protein M8J77_013357 [Diaphorina citri]